MRIKSFRFFCFCTVMCASLILNSAIYEKAGFYAGLSVGAGYNAGNFSGEGITVDEGERINTHDKISTCCFGKSFSGFVGYMTYLPKEDWLVGIEFGIEKPFYKKHFKTILWQDDHGGGLTTEASYRIKTLYVGKLHARIGKIFDDKWFVYGLAGVNVKRTQITMQPDVLLDMHGEKFVFGVAFGLGVEREISENWRLGLEVVNICYPSKSLRGQDSEMEFVYNSRVKTNSTRVGLRLMYNF